jgi:hypothetical protein
MKTIPATTSMVHTPGWAANMVDTGSRRFLRPVPFLSRKDAHS